LFFGEKEVFLCELNFKIMHKKLLIITFVMSVLAFAASVYLCVVMPDATSYVLAAITLLAAVYFFNQIRKNH
jgi:hypothetical protein